jgi:hypothetical protein
MTPAPLTHSLRNGSGKKPSKYPIQSYHQQMNTCLIALMHELQWDIVDKKKARDDDCFVCDNGIAANGISPGKKIFATWLQIYDIY